MIYKSFFRKKNTCIYLIIMILILTIFEILISGRNHYLKLCSKDYEGSYLAIPYKPNIIHELQEFKEIANIELGLMSENILIIGTDNLSLDEIILSETYISEHKINDVIELNLNNTVIPLQIKDFTPSINTFYINTNTLSNSINETVNKYYIIRIKNWLNYDKIVNKIENHFGKNTEIIIGINKKNQIDYEHIILLFNAFITLNIILFLIILLVTIFNIIEDDKKIILMYKALGFSKYQVLKTSILKILTLFLISFIISLTLSFIITIIIF